MNSTTSPFAHLAHVDPRQLWFQINEIFTERTYLQHRITIDEGDVVFDVGANVGVAAAFFASECRASRVYSFEPIEPIFLQLVDNTRRYPACTAEMCALGSHARVADITYYPKADAMSGFHADADRDARLVDRVMQNRGTPADDRRSQIEGRYEPITVACRVRTLSEILDESDVSSVDLLKIDVERSEVDVLKGIRPEHWDVIDQVVAEVHEEAGGIEIFEGMLAANGFDRTWDQARNMRGTGVHVVYASRRRS